MLFYLHCSCVHLYSSVELVLHLYLVLRDVSMLWREVKSKEFLINNKELLEVKFYRREVAKVMRESAEVVVEGGGCT